MKSAPKSKTGNDAKLEFTEFDKNKYERIIDIEKATSCPLVFACRPGEAGLLA